MGMPPSVAEFLAGKRFAVAGVSRDPRQVANLIYRKLRSSGYDVIPVNPNATTVEGTRCYPDLGQVDGALDGVLVATHPRVAVDLVRQCAERGVHRVWFHRAIGEGSVSDDAVRACRDRGMACIVGGCPMMYCEPVDPGHRCMRWLLRWGHRIPE